MKRKVNLVGQNTLTISLPTKWVLKRGIKKGQELEVTENGDSLIVQSNELAKKVRKVVLDIEKFDKLMLNRYLDELYRIGVEEIALKFSKDTIPDYKNNRQMNIYDYVKDVVHRFIGMEVISQKNNVIVLQSLITNEDVEKIDMVEHRLFFLIKEFFDEFQSSISGDFKGFHSKTYAYHDNIAKFTYYYFRLLNFSDLPEEEKTRLFGLYTMIDLVIDKLRHTSERFVEQKHKSKKLESVLKEIFSLFLEQFDIVFKKNFSLEEVDHIVGKRYRLVEKINKEKFNEEESRVMAECKILLDTINPFLEAYVARNMDKYLQP